MISSGGPLASAPHSLVFSQLIFIQTNCDGFKLNCVLFLPLVPLLYNAEAAFDSQICYDLSLK